MENLHLPRKSPPLGSHRGQVETQKLGEHVGKSVRRRSREVPETTPLRVKKRTGTCWRSPGSWSSSEHWPVLFSPGQESREEFRQKEQRRKAAQFIL